MCPKAMCDHGATDYSMVDFLASFQHVVCYAVIIAVTEIAVMAYSRDVLQKLCDQVVSLVDDWQYILYVEQLHTYDLANRTKSSVSERVPEAVPEAVSEVVPPDTAGADESVEVPETMHADTSAKTTVPPSVNLKELEDLIPARYHYLLDTDVWLKDLENSKQPSSYLDRLKQDNDREDTAMDGARLHTLANMKRHARTFQKSSLRRGRQSTFGGSQGSFRSSLGGSNRGSSIFSGRKQISRQLSRHSSKNSGSFYNGSHGGSSSKLLSVAPADPSGKSQ